MGIICNGDIGNVLVGDKLKILPVFNNGFLATFWLVFIILLGDETLSVLLNIERFYPFSLLRRVREVKLLKG